MSPKNRKNEGQTPFLLFDSASRLTQVTYPTEWGMTNTPRHVVVPSYDVASRLTQMNVDGGTYLGNVSYNAASQVTQLQTGAATSYPRTETYTYEASTGLLTGQVVNGTGGAPVYLNLSYDYSRGNSNGSTSGKTGQVTKVVDNLNRNRDRAYEFDSLGRLKSAKGGLDAGAPSGSGVTARWTQNYSYDRYGNKTGVTTGTGTQNVDELGNQVPADGLPSVSVNDTNNQMTVASGWFYDVTGNLLRGQDANGVWQRFEYDAAGRLKRVKDDAGTTVYETYTYGATRERLITETSAGRTYYVWGGSSVIAEYTEATTDTVPSYSKSYIYAGSRLLSTFTKASATTESKELHHPDRLGTALITDANGSNRRGTLPFGTQIAAETYQYDSSNKKFTSYDRNPSTGLDYAVNRTYSKGQTRFTQVDPLGMGAASIGHPQSNNLYAYTQNMPTDAIDPSGLQLIAFTMRVCDQPFDGPPYNCRDVVVHWMFIPDGSGGPGGDSIGGAGTKPPAHKKPNCGQSNATTADKGPRERTDILSKLNDAGVGGFISNLQVLKEGVTFDINDRAGFLSVLSSNQNFRHNTPFGAEHASTVGANIFTVRDFRSFTSGSNTLGADSTGYVRSLQVDVGEAAGRNPNDPTKETARGYADLDCNNPAQDIGSFVRHAAHVIRSWFN